jgi:hypothetical protein
MVLEVPKVNIFSERIYIDSPRIIIWTIAPNENASIEATSKEFHLNKPAPRPILEDEFRIILESPEKSRMLIRKRKLII